jgi:hypothetical protein
LLANALFDLNLVVINALVGLFGSGRFGLSIQLLGLFNQLILLLVALSKPVPCVFRSLFRALLLLCYLDPNSTKLGLSAHSPLLQLVLPGLSSLVQARQLGLDLLLCLRLGVCLHACFALADGFKPLV